MAKRVIRYVLLTFGYIFQYGLPLLLVGYVVPLTRGTQGAGLTTAGYLVLIIGLCITAWHFYSFINKQNKSLARAGLLSIFPIAIWAIGGIGLNNLLIFVTSLVDYWWTAFVFIIIGRLFFCIEEHLAATERDNNGN
jgi:hypothetical protein